MGEFLKTIPPIAALWLGILTSISPCPLATNLAAVSFIASRVTSQKLVLVSGALYTLGRMFTYAVLGSLICYGVGSAPRVSNFLQHKLPQLLSLLLILVGAFLLDILKIPLPSTSVNSVAERFAERGWALSSLLLGTIFALAFCPVSAALYFGALIPLSLHSGSYLLLPSLFGIGTALPVVVAAFGLAFSAQALFVFLDRIGQAEAILRKITGAIFIAVGFYYSLVYIFRVL